MAKKQIIIDGTTYDLGADAQNVDYTNAGMTGVTNAKGAIENLHTRVDAIENPNTDVVYTEEDCSVEGKYVYTNGGEISSNSYNCSDYITIPAGVKMFIKVNYALTYGLIFFYRKKNGDDYSWLTGKNYTSNEAIDDYTEVTIPDNAIAFRFSAKNGANDHIFIKFVQMNTLDDAVKLKVGAWNMGHFSGGSHDYSTITNDNVAAKRAAYRKVFDKVNADILCLSEFDPVFNSSDNATPQDEILCNYPYYKIGGKSGYNCNAVFSKLPILQTQEMSYTEKGANRYFKETTLKIKDKIVKVIATHLDFDSNYVNQLEELVSIYANDPYVIIGADFNIHIDDTWGDYVDGSGTDGFKNYKYLTDAGYTLMRFDYLDNDTLPNPWRYPAGDQNAGQLKGSAADNIAVKGFAMGKREFIYEEDVSNTLSDHCMIACELVML